MRWLPLKWSVHCAKEIGGCWGAHHQTQAAGGNFGGRSEGAAVGRWRGGRSLCGSRSLQRGKGWTVSRDQWSADPPGLGLQMHRSCAFGLTAAGAGPRGSPRALPLPQLSVRHHSPSRGKPGPQEPRRKRTSWQPSCCTRCEYDTLRMVVQWLPSQTRVRAGHVNRRFQVQVCCPGSTVAGRVQHLLSKGHARLCPIRAKRGFGQTGLGLAALATQPV